MVLTCDALDFRIREVIDNFGRKEIRYFLNQASFNRVDTDIIDKRLQSDLALSYLRCTEDESGQTL
jgi:hypothetical protein